jgi:flagellar hook-associated protein 1 FlgK
VANLLSTGISGLTAAQVALNTVGNNISNTNTVGYSRQVVQQNERIAPSGGSYTVGSGVDVQSVQRAYSQYLTSALWSSNASLQRATTYNNLATTLNSSLSASGDLQGALDNFYGAFSTVANTGDSSSRQALLGSASSLATVFNTLGKQLDLQQSQVNGQIGSTVGSINDIVTGIANLNHQIFQQSSATDQPNALLDQRDAMIKSLSGYVGISAVAQSDGTMSVYTSNGQTLVSGDKAFPLSSGSNAYDPIRSDIFDSSGNNITGRLSGGSLGALLDYRSNVLDPIQNQLGQAAIGLAASVNAQQASGLDLNGQQGSAVFSVPSPTVLGAAGNQGSATVAAAVSNVSQLTASDYVLRYSGTQWGLTTTAGQAVPLTTNPDGSLSADGLTFNVAGTAQAGDSYQIRPTRNAAAGLTVSLTDPRGIAAAAALNANAAGSNTGTATVGSIGVSNAGNPALLNPVTVSFPAAGTYQVTDAGGAVLAGGAYAVGQTIQANGWSLALAGAPAAGDAFKVAANTSGLNDNSNALAMAGLADTGVLNGGTSSVLNAYATLTTRIGSVGSQAATNLTTQTSLYAQADSAQQSVSGVNLDEEAANMVKYQQAYQASAQIISTAQSIFSSLLTAIHG